MKKYAVILVSIFLMSAFAQKKDYSSEPGYIDFGDLSVLESSEMVTEVIIEEHLLKMVSKMAQNEDDELASLIGGLKLIKVNAFEVSSTTADDIMKRIDDIDRALMSKNWDRIVKTKSRDESANVYIRTSDDELIVGLVVTAYEKNGDAAFVNIVGDINLETIGRLSQKFDIPSLDAVKSEMESENEKDSTEDENENQ